MYDSFNLRFRIAIKNSKAILKERKKEARQRQKAEKISN